MFFLTKTFPAPQEKKQVHRQVTIKVESPFGAAVFLTAVPWGALRTSFGSGREEL